MAYKGGYENNDLFRQIGFQVSNKTDLGKKEKNILTLSLNTTKTLA